MQLDSVSCNHGHCHYFKSASYFIGDDAYQHGNSYALSIATTVFRRREILRFMSCEIGPKSYHLTEFNALQHLLNLDKNNPILLAEGPYKKACDSFYGHSTIVADKMDMAILGSGIKDGLFVYVGSNMISSVAVFDGKASTHPRINSWIGIAHFADKLPCLKNCHLTQVVQQLFYVASNYDKEKTIVEKMAPRECVIDGEKITVDALDCISGPELLFTGDNLLTLPAVVLNCLEVSVL
jgi:hypothetical protein